MKSLRLRRKRTHRSNFLRGGRPSGLHLETLESRAMLAGQLDTTFGNGGTIAPDATDFTAFVGSNDIGTAVKVDANGKILAAGNSILGGVVAGSVARFNTDGSLDTTFGVGGKFATGFLTSVNDIALTAAGKVILVGPTSTANVDFGVIQLNANGAVDTTFGVQGHTAIDFASALADTPNAVVIQPTGEIVVAGSTLTAGANQDFAAVRLTATGSIDTTFAVATNNRFSVAGAPINERFLDVKLDSQNRIVLAGVTNANGNDDFAVSRLLPTGILDPAFGTGGTVITPVNGNPDQANALYIQSDPGSVDFVVAAGQSTNAAGNNDLAMVRYNSSGVVQGNFGNAGGVEGAGGGIEITDLSAGATTRSEFIFDVTQVGNRIIAVGGSFDTVGVNPAGPVVIARYDSVTGARDGSWNPSIGVLEPAIFGFQGNFANSVAVSGGNLVVLATAGNFANPNLALLRINATSGVADATFGTNGRVVADFTSFVGSPDAVLTSLRQSDGKLLVAGSAGVLGALARYNADGSLDTTFGNSGLLTVPQLSRITGLARRADGRILVGGSDAAVANSAVVQLSATGTLDPSFGVNGLLAIPVFNGAVATPLLIKLQGEKLIVAGSVTQGAGRDFAVQRYTTTGAIDLTFGVAGTRQITFGAAFTPVVATNANSQEVLRDMLLDPQGRILVAGSADNDDNANAATRTDFAIARLTFDGALDGTFSGDGLLAIDFGVPGNPNLNDVATSIALQGAGNNPFIIVGGTSDLQQHPITGRTDMDFALVRLNDNGLVQNGFGGNNSGKKLIDFNPSVNNPAPTVSNDTLSKIEFDASGRLVVVGSSAATGTGRSTAVATRLILDNATANNGALDSTFATTTGNKGFFTYSGTSFDQGNSFQIDSAGRILLAGTTLWNGSFGLLGVSPTGAVDSSFRGGKAAVTDFTPVAGVVNVSRKVITQPDGKLLVVGSTTLGAIAQGTITRYNTNGTLDSTFGLNGKVASTFLTDIRDVALTASGKIVAVGPTTVATPTGTVDLGVEQFNADGTVDLAGFGTAGTFGFDLAGQLLADSAEGVAIQADGKIVVVGNANFGGGDLDPFVLRLTVAGVLDTPSFGGGGGVVNPFATVLLEAFFDVALDSQQRIVVTGVVNSGASDNFIVMRLNSLGAADPSFGAGAGFVLTDFFGANDQANSLVIQTGDAIVAGGFATNANGNTDFALARYDSAGNLLNGFDNDGRQTLDFPGLNGGPSNDQIQEIKLSGTKIVAVGFTSEIPTPPNRQDAAAAVFDATTGAVDATLDPNQGPFLRAPFGGPGPNTANGLTIDSNGSWILAGQAGVSSLVQRLTGITPLNPDAAYTIRLLNQAGNTELTRDGNGRYIVNPGATITVEVSVQDKRTGATGVAAAYADLTYDLDFLDWNAGSLVVTADYPNTQKGTINDPAQLVDEAGGFAAGTALGSAARVLFTVKGVVKGTAPAGSIFNVRLDPADALPANDTILFGIGGGGSVVAPTAKITYESEPLVVSGTAAFPFQNPNNRFDVNGDGNVNNADAQAIYDFLANGGPRAVPTGTLLAPPPFLDVRGDGVVNAFDVGDVLNAIANPLALAATSAPAVTAPETLDANEAAAIVAAAIDLYAAAGASADQLETLHNVQFRVADLAGNLLGLQQGNLITLDVNAAGRGWFIDSTPKDNVEFQLLGNRLAAIDSVLTHGDVDLLTVVAHELGHILGLEDLDSETAGEDLMAEELTTGTRRLP